jgi:hypothetical protein
MIAAGAPPGNLMVASTAPVVALPYSLFLAARHGDGRNTLGGLARGGAGMRSVL